VAPRLLHAQVGQDAGQHRLNIGLDLNVISPTLFAMMVLLAVVTTMATTPILQLLRVQPLQPDLAF